LLIAGKVCLGEFATLRGDRGELASLLNSLFSNHLRLIPSEFAASRQSRNQRSCEKAFLAAQW
jgi:hypothetical protein